MITSGAGQLLAAENGSQVPRWLLCCFFSPLPYRRVC